MWLHTWLPWAPPLSNLPYVRSLPTRALHLCRSRKAWTARFRMVVFPRPAGWAAQAPVNGPAQSLLLTKPPAVVSRGPGQQESPWPHTDTLRQAHQGQQGLPAEDSGQATSRALPSSLCCPSSAPSGHRASSPHSPSCLASAPGTLSTPFHTKQGGHEKTPEAWKSRLLSRGLWETMPACCAPAEGQRSCAVLGMSQDVLRWGPDLP